MAMVVISFVSDDVDNLLTIAVFRPLRQDRFASPGSRDGKGKDLYILENR